MASLGGMISSLASRVWLLHSISLATEPEARHTDQLQCVVYQADTFSAGRVWGLALLADGVGTTLQSAGLMAPSVLR